MSFELRSARESDLEFLFECLAELRGGARYTSRQLDEYLREHLLLGHADFRILVGCDATVSVGMLTCNRFAMPRYLGFGVEIEEVVVHPGAQRRGFGRRMLLELFEQLRRDPLIRKIIVKTDDQLKAGSLYRQYFSVVQTTVYSQTVNLL